MTWKLIQEAEYSFLKNALSLVLDNLDLVLRPFDTSFADGVFDNAPLPFLLGFDPIRTHLLLQIKFKPRDFPSD